MGASDFVLKIQALMEGNAVSELEAAKSSAADALKEYQALERTSAQTASALEKLGASSAALQSKMQAAMEAGDTSAFWKLAGDANALAAKQAALEKKASDTAAAMDLQAQKVEQCSDAYAQLRDAEEASSSAAEDAATSQENFEKSAGGIKKLGGPLGSLGDKAEEFSEAWGALKDKLGTTGAAMAVGAAVTAALAAVVVAATYKLAAFGLKAADAQRNLKLTLEAMEGTAEGGGRLADAFSEIEGATGVGEDRLLDLTRSLKDAKVSAADMPAALRAIAMQEAALGDQGGTQALIDDLKSGKKTAAELGAEMEKQFGGVVEKKMLGVDQQMATLEKNLEDLFSGLNIEGVLKGFSKLVSLFDSSTESGQALKAIIEAAFGSLGDSEDIFNSIERFFLGMISSALTLAIWIKKIAKELGFDTGGLTDIIDAADLGKVALFSLLIPFAPLIVVIGVVGGLIYGLVAAYQFLSSAGSAALQWLTEAWDAVATALEEFDLAAVGTAMIDGLVEAIKAGATKVAGAIKDVAKGAIDGAKGVLGIASPSKVFEEIGGYTVEGFVGGVDAENDNATRAMENAITPPSASKGKGGSGGGGNTYSFTFNVNGENAQQIAEEAYRIFVGKLEDAGEQMGGGDAEEAA
jgi:hypothetical protein